MYMTPHRRETGRINPSTDVGIVIVIVVEFYESSSIALLLLLDHGQHLPAGGLSSLHGCSQ
jgi:hypothetical protein